MTNKVQILITGDFYGGTRCQELVQNKQFDRIFNNVTPLIQKADIAITNLEAPLIDNGQPIKKTGPAIKIAPQTIDALKFAGFNLVTLANNHIMDYGQHGLQSTIHLLEKHNIRYVGVGFNKEEASQTLFVEKHGISLAFINVAENEWSTTNGDYPGAHSLNIVANVRKIKEAKQKADFVILLYHGGLEMYTLPTPTMKETLRFFVDAGADAVLCHHSHCISGYEIYQQKPIFYGLGNFLFEPLETQIPDWYLGTMVQLAVDKTAGIQFEIIPIEQNLSKTGVYLLPENKTQEFLAKMETLNRIIANSTLLEKSFSNYVLSGPVAKTYREYLEPFNHLPFRILRRYKVFRSLLSAQKKRYYLNLMRCETHREVILKLMQHDSHSQ